jgi:hypothetical protein
MPGFERSVVGPDEKRKKNIQQESQWSMMLCTKIASSFLLHGIHVYISTWQYITFYTIMCNMMGIDYIE